MFATDNFQFRKRALIQCNTSLDFTYETNCTGFTISGTEPENTSRRIIFKIEDTLYRFVNGVLDKYPYRGEIDDILIYGNTVGELLELENLSAFVNKKVFVIIALDAPADAKVFPMIKIAVKVSTYNDDYTRYQYSQIYNLPSNSKIVSIREIKNEGGNATSISQCRIKKLSGWSDWLNLLDAEYQIASAIQFRTEFALTTLDGTDHSQTAITFKYTSDADKVAANFRTFTSLVENIDADLKTCCVSVDHTPLVNSRIQAYVNLREKGKRRDYVYLGKTSGIEQTLYLPNKFPLPDSLYVEIDGKPFFDFNYDTEKAALTFTAEPNLDVTAAYDYNRAENWQAMNIDFSNLNRTRFTFHTDDENLREAAIMIVLGQLENDAEFTATGTGRAQMFNLQGTPKTVNCNAPFKIDGQFISICAPIDSTVICSYHYAGEIPLVTGIIAGFSV